MAHDPGELEAGSVTVAEACYEAWRAHEDVAHPVLQETPWETGMRNYGRMSRIIRRPRWAVLTTAERQVWVKVAIAADLALNIQPVKPA